MVTLLLGALILLWAILTFRTVRGMNGLPGLPAVSFDNFNPGRVLMRVLGLIVTSLLPAAAVFVASDLLGRVLGLTATVIAAGYKATLHVDPAA